MKKFLIFFTIGANFYNNCSDQWKKCTIPVVIGSKNKAPEKNNKASLMMPSEIEKRCVQFLKADPLVQHAVHGLVQFSVSMLLNILVTKTNNEILNRYGQQIQDHALLMIPYYIAEGSCGVAAAIPTTIAAIFVTDALLDKYNISIPKERGIEILAAAGLSLGFNTYFYFDMKK